jgi:hypothetical protein
LSPFQGTLQVIEVPGARALSTDGVSWQVQLLGEAGIINWLGGDEVSWRYFVYGYWSATHGLARVPVHPCLDLQADDPALTALLDLLEEEPPAPFPPADNLELWLLDQAGQLPLALLQSAKGDAPPPEIWDAVWHPNLHGDTSFVAPSLTGPTASRNPWPHRDLLSRLVNRAVGPVPRAQWFLRDRSGNGRGLGGLRINQALHGRHLSSPAFPELLLREQWEQQADAELVRDFLDWQAPLLLTLAGLGTATRDRLERAACRRPMVLFKVRHLLPEVLNRELIQVPLVEAALTAAAL